MTAEPARPRASAAAEVPNGRHPQIRNVDPRTLRPAPDNPRIEVKELEALAKTLRKHGVVQPLVVTPDGLVVVGHRRHQAALRAGLAEVPVIERRFADDKGRVAYMLMEQLHRVDLSPLEEAVAIRRLQKDMGLSQKDIAAEVGKTESWVSKSLALLRLPERAQRLVQRGLVPVRTTPALTRLLAYPAALEQLLDDIEAAHAEGMPIDIPAVADMYYEEARCTEREDQAREQLLAEGVRLLTGPLAAGHVRLGRAGDHLRMPVAEHAAFPCHAARIERGEIVYVCTNPSAHRAGVRPRTVAPAELDRHLRHRARFRREWMRSHLQLRGARMPAHAGLRTWRTSEAVLDTAAPSTLRLSAELLGVRLGPADEPPRALRRWAAENGEQEQLARMELVSLAIAFAHDEAVMRRSQGEWTDAHARHYEYLVGQGYELDEAERAAWQQQQSTSRH